jgi:hypothetical protein
MVDITFDDSELLSFFWGGSKSVMFVLRIRFTSWVNLSLRQFICFNVNRAASTGVSSADPVCPTVRRKRGH